MTKDSDGKPDLRESFGILSEEEAEEARKKIREFPESFGRGFWGD